ncbi:unnamed protein product [Didymodactylos carnosus]|uniref:Uncharacterized protein n=1 Tax=Didymodactylos carnosus TaxID=1234261 RepID=A0A814CW66_9BILA|nr:unnamed protein product [Didymodactylos carnosus]CAF0945483.1 unnamed protein product [Didymodactylos carnosus]CAF3633933.1 unnamed protein product [Didymodactylos carnosus]CAF3721667.1 unnamed protein product [Didymodactylos carnosus]
MYVHDKGCVMLTPIIFNRSQSDLLTNCIVPDTVKIDGKIAKILTVIEFIPKSNRMKDEVIVKNLVERNGPWLLLHN